MRPKKSGQFQCPFSLSDFLMGSDKRGYITALRLAKIYPPWQAAAAADHGLRLVDCERLLLVTFQTSFYGNFDFLGN